MKIVITGGSGLLGRALTNHFAADGHETVVLSRAPERVSGLPSGARAVAWDARTAMGWGHEVDGADAIINLAGENIGGSSPLNMRWTQKRREAILASRLNAGHAVVAAIEAAENKPAVLLQSSAVGFYGRDVRTLSTENEQAGDGFLAEVTQAWEDSTQSVEKLGVRRVVLRTGVVLDNDNFAFQMIKLPYQLFVGGRLGSGKQYLAWIHIDDFVSAVDWLLTREEATGAYNIVAPGAETMDAFGKQVGGVMHRPHWLPVPSFALRLALGEVADTVLGGQNAYPQRLLESGFTFDFPDADSALRDLID